MVVALTTFHIIGLCCSFIVNHSILASVRCTESFGSLVTDYQMTLRNIHEDRRRQVHRGQHLNSRRGRSGACTPLCRCPMYNCLVAFSTEMRGWTSPVTHIWSCQFLVLSKTGIWIIDTKERSITVSWEFVPTVRPVPRFMRVGFTRISKLLL